MTSSHSEGRISDVLAHGGKKTRVVTEMLFRTNFMYADSTVQSMQDSQMGLQKQNLNLLYNYAFGDAYQSGALLSDTFADTMLANAFLAQRQDHFDSHDGQRQH